MLTTPDRPHDYAILRWDNIQRIAIITGKTPEYLEELLRKYGDKVYPIKIPLERNK